MAAGERDRRQVQRPVIGGLIKGQMQEILISAFAMGFIMLLSGGIYWGMRKIGLSISWRAAILKKEIKRYRPN